MSYVDVTLDNNGGTYTALGPQECLTLEPFSGAANPPPRILFTPPGWLYLSGYKPSVRGPDVDAGSDHSKLVIHDIPAAGSTPARMRVILIEGTSAWVILRSTNTTENLKEGEYIDLLSPSSGTPTFSSAATFDRDTTEGSQGLMDTIDTVRAARGID